MYILTGLLVLCSCGRQAPRPVESVETEQAGDIHIQAQAGDAIFTQVCAACHGPAGEGKVEMKTPSIGGLPAWYTQAQLNKFKKGWRGFEPQDALAVQMRMIASSLSEAQAEAVTEYIASLPQHPMVNTLKGDVKKGRVIYEEICIACHRYNASGELVFGSPPLTGLQDWYLADQMEKFKTGKRGMQAEDELGQKMSEIMQHLMNQQEFYDVLAYVAELANDADEK